tara:strand:+ start:890 stop:1123 length:234 start_codon:yes stop_codon:yes gene_type:complete
MMGRNMQAKMAASQAGCFLFELRRKRTSLSGYQTPRLWWRYYHLRWCLESLNHYTGLFIYKGVYTQRKAFAATDLSA